MDVDRALVDFGRHAPDAVEQLRAREDPAGLFQQIFEQAELGRPEMDVARAAAHAARLAVEVEVAGGQLLGDRARAGCGAAARARAPSAPAPRTA